MAWGHIPSRLFSVEFGGQGGKWCFFYFCFCILCFSLAEVLVKCEKMSFGVKIPESTFKSLHFSRVGQIWRGRIWRVSFSMRFWSTFTPVLFSFHLPSVFCWGFCFVFSEGYSNGPKTRMDEEKDGEQTHFRKTFKGCVGNKPWVREGLFLKYETLALATRPIDFLSRVWFSVHSIFGGNSHRLNCSLLTPIPIKWQDMYSIISTLTSFWFSIARCFLRFSSCFFNYFLFPLPWRVHCFVTYPIKWAMCQVH